MRTIKAPDLEREAQLLARPASLLVLEPSDSADPTAFWSGMHENGGLFVRPHLVASHISSEWLRISPAPDGESVTVSPETEPVGRPLFLVQSIALPPPEAIFLFGSSDVETWLAAEGCTRDEAINTGFTHPLIDEYLVTFQRQHPLYTSSAAAMLGGWHFPWPDGDWLALSREQHLVTTFIDSEPWLEVWAGPNGIHGIQRLT